MSGGPVLCAFDATEPSLLAAYAAADLAEQLQSELELVYVVDHDDLPALPPHGAGIDPYVRDALPQIQEQIAEDAACAQLRAALSALPEGNVTGSVLTGLPARAVLVGDDGSEHGDRAVRHGEALAARIGRPLQRLRVEHGSAAEALAEAARAERAYVAVVGARGRGAFRGQLFGSVSAELVRTGGRPVMVVGGHTGT